MALTEIMRPTYRRDGLRYASDTTDEEWALIEPHLPPPASRGRTDARDAIHYIAESGYQWRRLPKVFPPYTMVQRYFLRMARQRAVAGHQPRAAPGSARICRPRGQSDCRRDRTDSQSVKTTGSWRSTRIRRWQECASKARIIYGGRFHPESCRLIRKLTSGAAGRLASSKPRDKGRLGWPSDPTGRNVSEVRAGLEKVDADADPPFARGRPRGQGSNRQTHLSGLPGYWTQHVGMVMRVIEGDPSGS